MERYLITHSLLSAWLYSMRDDPFEDAARNPMEDFLRVLHREETPATDAMQAGIDFENLVTAVLNGTADAKVPWYTAAEKIAQQCAGGILQYKARKQIEVDGLNLLLYGRLDCLKAGEIMDIKFSTKYSSGKYFASTQHPVYLELVPEARQFTYLISNGSSVWTETYRREETLSIYPVISDFLVWLQTVGLLQTYKETWRTL